MNFFFFSFIIIRMVYLSSKELDESLEGSRNNNRILILTHLSNILKAY